MDDLAPTASLPITALTGDAVVTVRADAPLTTVADVLVEAEVGAVVVRAGGRPSAVLSERDLVRAIAGRRSPETTCAADVANPSLIWCDSTATVGEVAGKMMDEYVRHVLVEEDGELVGIVSARDLLGVYASAGPL